MAQLQRTEQNESSASKARFDMGESPCRVTAEWEFPRADLRPFDVKLIINLAVEGS